MTTVLAPLRIVAYPSLPITFAVAVLCGCSGSDLGDGADDDFLSGGKTDSDISEGSAEALGVLKLVNEASLEVLDVDVALLSQTARNIVAHREGPDQTPGTEDDELYESLAELDAVPYVGPYSFARLLEYALAMGFVEEAPDAGEGDAGADAGANDEEPDRMYVTIGDTTLVSDPWSRSFDIRGTYGPITIEAGEPATSTIMYGYLMGWGPDENLRGPETIGLKNLRITATEPVSNFKIKGWARVTGHPSSTRGVFQVAFGPVTFEREGGAVASGNSIEILGSVGTFAIGPQPQGTTVRLEPGSATTDGYDCLSVPSARYPGSPIPLAFEMTITLTSAGDSIVIPNSGSYAVARRTVADICPNRVD